MIKKILTTKAHLVVLFLWVLYLCKYMWWMPFGTWDLNRTIGWGWDLTNYLYFISPMQTLWGLVFSVVYWRILNTKKEINFILILLQVLLLMIVISSFYPFSPLGINSLFIGVWLLFFIIVAVSFLEKTKGESL